MKACLSTIADGRKIGVVNIQINTRFLNLVRGIIPYKNGMVTFEASGRLDINHEQKTLRVEDLAVVQLTYSTRKAAGLRSTTLNDDPSLVTAALAELLTANNDALYSSYKDFDIEIHHNDSELSFQPEDCRGVVRLSVDANLQDDLAAGLAVDHYEVGVAASYAIKSIDSASPAPAPAPAPAPDQIELQNVVVELEDYDLFGVVDDCYTCTMTGDLLPASVVDELTIRARHIIEKAFVDTKGIIVDAKELACAV